ncbi:MAG: hypothetical protein DWQ06_15175 [Calditrichaeota bacterium]|nr:MAG: hypothetical protein DWQ06_15175 [Calditrichota bacterium]
MEDLNFTYQIYKNGDVLIRHNGLTATTLRGKQAMKFKSQIETLDFAELQQIMARLTGNYKRGNERLSKKSNKK